MESITRRDMISGTAVAVAGVAAGGLCLQGTVARAADGGSIFEGRAQGLRGWVTVHVTLSAAGDAIEAVDVVESTEAPHAVCGKAIAAVPGRIVEAQSTDVDGVTGATFTSNAIMAAAAQALEVAGVADAFAAPSRYEPDGSAQDVEADVLVLGAGGAGCMAALAARYEDFDGVSNDLSVILVERQGFYGGSSMLSGGSIGTAIPLNDTSNVEARFDEYMAEYEGGSLPVNRELTYNMLMASGANILKMQSLGYPVATAAYLGSPDSYDSLTAEVRRYRYARQYYSPDHWPWQGVDLQTFFDERFEAAGVDVRLDTEVIELVLDTDGSVTGARVSGPDGEYVITAKKTIMALGGIAQSRDMLERYAPDFAACLPYTNASCRGDGIRMAAEQVGATVSGNYATGMLGPDMRTGFWSDLGAYFPGWSSTVMLVNAAGERFMYDGDGYDVYESFNQACQQENATVYAVFDAENSAAERAEGSTMGTVAPHIFKADTLRAAAEAAGVDADVLQQTVDAYNASYDAGEDDAAFAVPHDAMTPVKAGPFYVVELRPFAYATNVGVNVSEDLEVLDADGEPVPNLYAAGEMIWTGTGMEFLGGAIVGGRLAGENAKTAILG